jgi:hypothetical protein
MQLLAVGDKENTTLTVGTTLRELATTGARLKAEWETITAKPSTTGGGRGGGGGNRVHFKINM